MTTPQSSSDRLTPHSPEAEQSVLGCILLSPNECMAECIEKSKGAAVFYDLRHQAIFDTVAKMFASREAVDVITLQQRLKDGGRLEEVGGISYLAALPDTVPSTANLGYYLDIVLEKHQLRKVLQACARGADRVYNHEGKVEALLDEFERDVMAIRRDFAGAGQGEVDLKTALCENIDEYEAAMRDGKPPGVRTGFHDLDKLIGGLKPQQLVIIAARPSVGKTALALNIAEHVAIEDRLPVGFFSLEMSGRELIHRLTCGRARVDGSVLNEGRMREQDFKAVTVAQGQIANAPLFICEQGGLTLAQLTARARRMVQQHQLKLLIVDYLGLVRSGEKGRSRYEDITLVSNGLKALAKELNLPLIALAQLNRDTEKENRAPRLSDLRDSGAIEQDGDIIGLLHRDENQTDDTQRVSLILAKQRNGRTGKVELKFRRAFTRFENNNSFSTEDFP